MTEGAASWRQAAIGGPGTNGSRLPRWSPSRRSDTGADPAGGELRGTSLRPLAGSRRRGWPRGRSGHGGAGHHNQAPAARIRLDRQQAPPVGHRVIPRGDSVGLRGVLQSGHAGGGSGRGARRGAGDPHAVDVGDPHLLTRMRTLFGSSVVGDARRLWVRSDDRAGEAARVRRVALGCEASMCLGRFEPRVSRVDVAEVPPLAGSPHGGTRCARKER